VSRHEQELVSCYEQGLVGDEDLAGNVRIAFRVSASGAVAHASIEDTTLGNQGVERCYLEAVRGWTMPSDDPGPSAEVSVNGSVIMVP